MLLGQVLWLVLALAGPLGFRASLLGWRPALMLVAVGLGGLVLTGFISLVALFWLLRSGRPGGPAICLPAAGIGLVALIGLLLVGLRGAQAPPIHDITTDPGNPPLFAAAAQLRGEGDNLIAYPGEAVAGVQRKAYPDLVPIEVALAPAEAFARCLGVAERLGWTIVGQNRDQGMIEAIDRTLVFGFTDDIAIRIVASGDGSRIDLRSASRAGVGDFGTNAKRICSFAAAFRNP
ncbi:MAG: DUF1499 domain-containing protein [Desulfobulbus sp.]|uniref:DUF1499 domain-containing protein n=1 Tax=Desulfobulbus sp. TaxID=895 RepID=UPI0028498AFE|nr:DUF1499 domain-containing protein [Desulfobulbus sp.]MDR2549682.1 DUF1499 domain-containing protein [Desulfobulbus sp.]